MNHSEFFRLTEQGLPCGTFVLHGEEEYVKEQAIRAVTGTVEPDLAPFNVSELEKPTPQTLSETCETLPLFSDRRIVVCRELPEGTEFSKYKEIFESHSPETLLLMVFKGKLASNNGALKLAQKMGTEVLFDTLSQNECIKWCVKHMSKAGVLMTPDTARVFTGIVGTDMANLVSETDKLIDYVGSGNSVTPQDITVCTRASLDVRIFDMLDMFTNGKQGDGILALHALLNEGNEPLSIAAFLASRFKLMLEARRGIEAGKNKRDTASSMEGNRYANERAYDAARRFTSMELMELISELSDTAFQKISGNVKDDKYLELILLKQEWRQFPV